MRLSWTSAAYGISWVIPLAAFGSRWDGLEGPRSSHAHLVLCDPPMWTAFSQHGSLR